MKIRRKLKIKKILSGFLTMLKGKKAGWHPVDAIASRSKHRRLLPVIAVQASIRVEADKVTFPAAVDRVGIPAYLVIS
jgi:hypothetical protein